MTQEKTNRDAIVRLRRISVQSIIEPLSDIGFKICCGNPPYVETWAKDSPYKNFQTLSAANLYTLCTERSRQLFKKRFLSYRSDFTNRYVFNYWYETIDEFHRTQFWDDLDKFLFYDNFYHAASGRKSYARGLPKTFND